MSGSRVPFVLAHLSDLHISLDEKGRSIRATRRLVEHVLHHTVDHIVITGDITANGTAKELEIARSIFESYGLLDARKLSVVIGNHDVFGGVRSAEDVLAFPRRCRSVDYEEAVKRFGEVFEEVFRGAISPAGTARFPFVKPLGSVALFGVNSVARYSRLKNPFGSNGAVHRKQRYLLENLLIANDLRHLQKVVLIHHHFSRTARVSAGTMEYLWRTIERRTMKLHKKRKLLRLFARNGVRVVLHGHIHQNAEYERRGVLFLNTGASVIGATKQLTYRLVVVEQDHLETSLHHISETSHSRKEAAVKTRPMILIKSSPSV